MMCQSIFVHQTYGRCWCSQSKRDALVFFFRLQWVGILCFQSAPKNNSQTSPKHVSFDVQCTTLVCWKPVDIRPTSNPNVQSQTLVFIICISKPCKTQPMFAFSLGLSRWVFGRKFVTMLVCDVCFAVNTVFGLQTKQECSVVCCAGPSSWWTCQLLNTCRSGK